MKYTKEQKAALVRAFKGAKKHLWNGQREEWYIHEQYICMAISYAYVSKAAKDMAREVIFKRLNGSVTVGQWLIKRGFFPQTQQQLQDYRHRWLDALIAEFSK